MTACPHADLMAMYAEDAKTHAEPWKLWQFCFCDKWKPLDDHPSWLPENNYRRIPRTVTINGIECPEPMRVRPEMDERYWYINLMNAKGIESLIWENDSIDKRIFLAGQCFATEDHALQHYRAQIAPTKQEGQL